MSALLSPTPETSVHYTPNTGILLLALDYLLGAYLGVFSSTEWSFWFTTVFHLVLCAAIVVRASAVDVTSHASITAFYMLVWKLFYIEYIALPFFVR